MTMLRVSDVEVPPAPTACPFCRSLKITTASKQVDASTYWRCTTCGQLWNVGRLKEYTHYGRR